MADSDTRFSTARPRVQIAVPTWREPDWPAPTEITITAPRFGTQVNVESIDVAGSVRGFTRVVVRAGLYQAENSPGPQGAFCFAGVPILSGPNVVFVGGRDRRGRIDWSEPLLVYQHGTTRGPRAPERRDPSSRWRIQPGDDVVLCGLCRVMHLRLSWTDHGRCTECNHTTFTEVR